jgi:hypothetical protein
MAYQFAQNQQVEITFNDICLTEVGGNISSDEPENKMLSEILGNIFVLGFNQTDKYVVLAFFLKNTLFREKCYKMQNYPKLL